jgi:hypothetical protein
VCALGLALAGCGGSSTPSVAEKPPIRFTTSALTRGRQVPASFHCDPRIDWLPLRWGALPAHTAELALYIVRFGPPHATQGGAIKASIEGEAIIAGLKPTLSGLAPGKFPSGSRVAIHRNASGRPISICPPKGVRTNLLYRIYALPRKIELSEHANLVSMMSREALAAGTFIFSYRPT